MKAEVTSGHCSYRAELHWTLCYNIIYRNPAIPTMSERLSALASKNFHLRSKNLAPIQAQGGRPSATDTVEYPGGGGKKRVNWVIFRSVTSWCQNRKQSMVEGWGGEKSQGGVGWAGRARGWFLTEVEAWELNGAETARGWLRRMQWWNVMQSECQG